MDWLTDASPMEPLPSRSFSCTSLLAGLHIVKSEQGMADPSIDEMRGELAALQAGFASHFKPLSA